MADNLRYHPREAAKRDAVKDYVIKKWRKDVAAGREAAQAEAARRREAQWDIPSPGTPNAPGIPRDQFGRPHTFPKRLPSSEAIGAIIPRRVRPLPAENLPAENLAEPPAQPPRAIEPLRPLQPWQKKDMENLAEPPAQSPMPIEPVRRSGLGPAKRAVPGLNLKNSVIDPARRRLRKATRTRDIMSKGMRGAGVVDPMDRVFPPAPVRARPQGGIDPNYWH